MMSPSYNGAPFYSLSLSSLSLSSLSPHKKGKRERREHRFFPHETHIIVIAYTPLSRGFAEESDHSEGRWQ
jgi:hypothetical protein